MYLYYLKELDSSDTPRQLTNYDDEIKDKILNLKLPNLINPT